MNAIASNFATDLHADCSVVRLFGTLYVHQKTSDGGDLWLTVWGWPWRHHLQPEVWFKNGQYTTLGTRLGYSTGHVYKMVSAIGPRKLSFVAKLSRVAQQISSSGLLQSSNRSRRSVS
jgi:hypothetical protein